MSNFRSTLIFFGILFFVLSYSSTFADEPGTKIKSSKWVSLVKSDLIAVDYRYEECKLSSQGTNQELVYLHIKNRTKKSLHISYDLLKYYNGKCLNCDGRKEGTSYSIDIKSGQSLEGSCETNTNNALCIFSKMLNVPAVSILTNFEFTNLKVEIK